MLKVLIKHPNFRNRFCTDCFVELLQCKLYPFYSHLNLFILILLTVHFRDLTISLMFQSDLSHIHQGQKPPLRRTCEMAEEDYSSLRTDAILRAKKGVLESMTGLALLDCFRSKNPTQSQN